MTGAPPKSAANHAQEDTEAEATANANGLPSPRARPKRLRDLALLLSLLGLLLFLTPITDILANMIGAEDAPALKVIYVFGAWALLIALAFWISRSLSAHLAIPQHTKPTTKRAATTKRAPHD